MENDRERSELKIQDVSEYKTPVKSINTIKICKTDAKNLFQACETCLPKGRIFENTSLLAGRSDIKKLKSCVQVIILI